MDENELFELIHEAVMDVRDAHPRHPHDADSAEVTDAVLLALTRRALRDEREGALRWIDSDGTYQARIEADESSR